MKNKVRILVLLNVLFVVLSFKLSAQLPDTWTQKSDFGGTARYGAVGFSIGEKGYLGTGYSTDWLKDFWEYDAATDTWSQKADFAGTKRVFASGFAIADKGYVGCGTDLTQRTDFWEYNPATNTWTQKADFAGVARDAAVGFSIGTKGYIGTGLTGLTTRLNDFWEYDPATDSWMQKSNVGGPVRAFAAGFSIAGKGYIGTGNSGALEKDFWEYNPTTDTWTKKADFPGISRFGATAFNIQNFGYIGTGDIGGIYANDFFEYNPLTDTWISVAALGGILRSSAVGFGIGNNGYVGTGYNTIIESKDFWQYTPNCIPPHVTSQPADQVIVYGSSATFTVVATDAIAYQWQEDSGAGFIDIFDGGIYSNTSTAQLQISLPDVAMSGYKYRCVVSGGCLPVDTTDGNATLVVSAKPIVITADAGQTKIYGDSDPATYTYTFAPALLGSDVISGTMNRAAGENAGSYAFTLGTLSAGPNYSLAVASLPEFTITTKALLVKADDKYKCFDGSVYSQGFTVNYFGFVSGDDESDLSGTLIFNGTAPAAVAAGVYTIEPAGLSSGNYLITYVNGELTIDNSPSPTIAGINTVCAGTTAVQYTTEPGFTNYVWTISYGGIITSGLNSNQVTVNWGTAGSRSISVNYQNTTGCFSSVPATKSVNVLSVPVPIISGETEVCSASSNVAYSTQPNYTDYIWNISAGGTITSGAGTNAVTVNWNGSGNQTVSVSFTNDLGCSALAPTYYNVQVAPLPAPATAILGDASVCKGVSGVIYTVPAIENAEMYIWTIPAGASIVAGNGSNTITVDFSGYAVSGTISVFGQNSCGNGVLSPNFVVAVNPVPQTPAITQHGDTLTSSAASGNQWYLDGVEIPGATGQQHMAVYIGTYTVQVTLSGCSSGISNEILVYPVSVDENPIAEGFEVYPNPGTGIFKVQVPALKSNDMFSLQIFNNQGSLVSQKQNVSTIGNNLNEFDITGFPSGVYTVVLKSEKNTFVKRIILTR